MDEVLYTLKYPIETKYRGPEGERTEKKSEITLRRPKAKDMRGLAGITSPVLQSLYMIGALSDLADHEVDKLDTIDLEAISGLIEGFYDAWPADWQDLIGLLAVTFPFSMEELWNVTADDLRFWIGQAEKHYERVKRA